MPETEARLLKIPTTEEKSGDFNVVVETPRGSEGKYKYDTATGLFLLDKQLPAGLSFPCPFGFIPGTSGEDGDPVDVLALTDIPVPVGCLLHARLIGVLQAEQTEPNKKPYRNDRLIAVASVRYARQYAQVKTLDDLESEFLDQLGRFFEVYNAAEGRTFKILGHGDAAAAKALVEEGQKRFKRSK